MRHLISIKTKKGVISIEEYKANRIATTDVIGVVLQTETIGVVISLYNRREIWCIESNRKVFNKACDKDEALQTLNGLELTRNIFQKNQEDGESITAAKYCWTYNRGDLQWYLPCLYELCTILTYRDELNKVMAMLNADLFDEGDCIWSSSECDSGYAWYVNSGGVHSIGYGYKHGNIVVRAVSAFIPLQRDDSPLQNENGQQLTEASAIEYLRKLGYTGELVKKVNV